MAEKTNTKKSESEKETHKEPVADIAEEVVEKNPEANEKDVLKSVEKEIKGNDSKENGESVEKSKEKDEEPKKVEEKSFESTRERKEREKIEEKVSSWKPKTSLGKEVKEGKIKDINEILENKRKILEDSIIDSLIDAKTDLIAIGQSKGKFGGGKRRAWRQTQKKTKKGNIPKFSTMAVAGDENGHVGVGVGDSTETLPARDKAIRKAKLNMIKVRRACGAFDCACSEPHTIPFEVSGKKGSVKVILIPAPQGTGLVVADHLKKILQLAGIKDVYSKTFGQKKTTFNLVKACMNALEKTNEEK